MQENEFGEFLYQLRKEQGITQTALADLLGITNRAVSNWETGECFPETAQLIPLANILNVTVDELLKGRREVPKQGYATSHENGEEKSAVYKGGFAGDGKPQDAGRTYEEEAVRENFTAERHAQIAAENNRSGDSVSSPQKKSLTKAEAFVTATGVALILIGVLLIVVLSQLQIDHTVYLPIFFVLLSIAVFLFITMGMYKEMKELSAIGEQSSKARGYIFMVASGASVTILGVIALVSMGEGEADLTLRLCLFFAALTVGVFLLIFGGCLWGSFIKQTERIAPAQERIGTKTVAEKILDAISGIIMMLATGIFLLLGFGWGLWHPGWVVFPVGGLLCGIVSTIASAVKKD